MPRIVYVGLFLLATIAPMIVISALSTPRTVRPPGYSGPNYYYGGYYGGYRGGWMSRSYGWGYGNDGPGTSYRGGGTSFGK